MANTIDYGTLAIGALIGVGCRNELKSAAKVAATTAASLVSSAAIAANSIAAQMYDGQKPDQNGQAADQNGQAGQAGNGN